MRLWNWCLIILILCVIMCSLVEGKSRRKPHHRHRHSKNKKHNHRHSKNHGGGKPSVRKKRSQLGESLNNTNHMIFEAINFTSMLPSTKPFHQKNEQDLQDLETIFTRIYTKSQYNTNNLTLINKNTRNIHKSTTPKIISKNLSFLNLNSSQVINDLSQLFGETITESHAILEKDDLNLIKIFPFSSPSTLIRQKRQLSEESVMESLYDDRNSDSDNRKRRFADTSNFLNDENSIYRNSLEDIYPEAAEDFEYHLPLAKLVRTKRLDNLESKSSKISRDSDKKKFINNSLKNLGVKIDDSSRDKRQKVGNYNVGVEKKLESTAVLNSKNVQTRSVQEVKRLAEKLVAKVDELENCLNPSLGLNVEKTGENISGKNNKYGRPRVIIFICDDLKV